MLDWLPRRKKQREDKERARVEAEATSRREQEADKEIVGAYKLANRLAQHRRENHFAQRIRAAYRGEAST